MANFPLPLLLAAFSPVLLLAQSPDNMTYSWAATGPLQVARQGACAATLSDGRILVAGGQDSNGALHSVEIYQQDGTFAPAADLLRARSGQTCTSLADGRVLVAGGLGDGPAIAAETYDPTSNTWTAAEFGTERWNHSATLLSDGRVLLAAGETAGGPSDLLEWFNPATNRIRPLPRNLSAARTLHTAALLPDGSVLISGGWNAQNLLDSLEIVKLDGRLFDGGALPVARAGHTASSLDTGCVLLAGGVGTDGDLASADLYCPDKGAITAGGAMSLPRYGHLAIQLPGNGKILVTGGFSGGEATPASEIYDPASNSFVAAGALTLARLGMTAVADPISGAVLAVGGSTADGPVAACGILHAPTVVFDKTRYLDGDSITVSGLTWTPGEKVNLVFSQTTFVPPGQLSQIVIQNFQTTASALGRIQMTLATAGAAGAGLTFRITATGVTSGLTASNQARQISRTNMTLTVSPFPALTRQPVTLQALVQPAKSLDTLDGTVTFLLGSTTLGSVSSTNQFTSVSTSGSITTITDGTSNTIMVGETLPANSTGFGTTFFAGDGSVRTVNPGGVFQLTTRDIPAGTNVLTANSPGSVTASYAAFNSLYGPSSATTTVSVQKRAVNVTISTPLFFVQPKVGEPIQLTATVSPMQRPLADVAPTGTLHVGIAPGVTIDVPLVPSGLNQASRVLPVVTLPAGVRTFSANYDGDNVYQPGSVSNAGSITIGKGNVGFALIPSKSSYTVGEPISLIGRIQHPKVQGATPTGQITRSAGPTQFQGATVAADPQNTGLIDTNLPVTGLVPAGNFAVTMNYGGDANFSPATAGTILTIAKAVPTITVIPPAQIVAGQPATFTVRTAAPAGLTLPPTSGSIVLTGIANGASSTLAGTAGTIRQTFPTAGTFTVKVQYNGDANYQATTSSAVTVVVQ